VACRPVCSRGSDDSAREARPILAAAILARQSRDLPSQPGQTITPGAGRPGHGRANLYSGERDTCGGQQPSERTDMSPRTTRRDTGSTDPMPATAPAEGSSVDAATPDAPSFQDPPASALPARPSVAQARPTARASARVGPRVKGDEAPGGPGRVAADEAAAYQEALRQAFRSAIPLEPAGAAPRPAPAPKTAPDPKAEPRPGLEPEVTRQPAREPIRPALGPHEHDGRLRLAAQELRQPGGLLGGRRQQAGTRPIGLGPTMAVIDRCPIGGVQPERRQEANGKGREQQSQHGSICQ